MLILIYRIKNDIVEVLEQGFYYHIYNRGNNKENIFREEENYYYFLKLYDKYIEPIADTFAWCLMPNHFHFLVRIKDINSTVKSTKNTKLPHQYFSNLFNAYAKAINKKYSRTGSLFQSKFRRKKITGENYLRNLVQYIHLNPQHHEFVNDFRNYTFSSYQSIVSNKLSKIKRTEVIELFGDLENFQYVSQKECDLEILKSIIDEDL